MLTKGEIFHEIMSTKPDQFGRNWMPELYNDLVVKRDHRGDDVAAIFDELLDKRVIRPGMQFTCSNCNSTEWYHVSEFAEEYTCRFCFDRQRVHFGSAKQWQYRADGLFQKPNSAEGSVAAILALWRLDQTCHSPGGHYYTGTNLCGSAGNVEFEIDYCYLATHFLSTSYEFVIGEAKAFVEYDEPKLERLTTIADKFSVKPFIAVTTLKDAFSDAEKQLLRGIVKKGYALIPLTRLELDPYDLHQRFEAASTGYVGGLADLSDSAIHVNLRP
jgi:hypothetical protein